MRSKSLIIIFIFSVIVLSCNGSKNKKYLNYNIPLSTLIDSLNTEHQPIHLLIDKSENILYVLVDKIQLKIYPVVFGGNAIDDKKMQGDQCTPEGSFKVLSKYPHKSWSKFIWIDYPNVDSWRKHNLAKQKGEIPKDAKIGGEIGIHGVPKGTDFLIDMKTNWTLGCIAMKNKDVNEIYPYVNKNTLVVIQK